MNMYRLMIKMMLINILIVWCWLMSLRFELIDVIMMMIRYRDSVGYVVDMNWLSFVFMFRFVLFVIVL